MGLEVAFPAGWPLRHCGLASFVDFVETHQPPLVELSKDFLNDGVSLKRLGRELTRVRESTGFEISFAGTTDLVTCSGFSWERYREYLAVQATQARFLGCTKFRLLLGDSTPSVSADTIIQRVNEVCEDFAPLRVCVEIHGGIESDPAHLQSLLGSTDLDVVVDLENMHRAGLSAQALQAVLPAKRIAYFHVRNLDPIWVEHPQTLDEASAWQRYCGDGIFLWEPKTIHDSDQVRGCFREYRTSD